MAYKHALDSNKIFNKEFEITNPGYDALQVDTFLDIVIKDYENFEATLSAMKRENKSLNDKIDSLLSEIDELKMQKAELDGKLSTIQNNEGASLNNLELLKRISLLEKTLNKLGVNPNTIK